jgi:hypothetical protein
VIVAIGFSPSSAVAGAVSGLIQTDAESRQVNIMPWWRYVIKKFRLRQEFADC